MSGNFDNFIQKKFGDFYAHESSVLDNCKIGYGTKIWHFCHVSNEVEIGCNCILGQNVYIGPGVKIGNGVKIQNNVSIYTGVTIQDDVFVGPSVVFTNVNTPRAFVDRKDQFRPTLVKQGASIGANATIVCGATLGEFCLIGAGALVSKDVANYEIVIGNPIRRYGYACKCGNILTRNTVENKVLDCPCGLRYKFIEIENGGILPKLNLTMMRGEENES